jgi:hypothetical protein
LLLSRSRRPQRATRARVVGDGTPVAEVAARNAKQPFEGDMKMRRGLSAVVLAGMAMTGANALAETVQANYNGDPHWWHISQPNVNEPRTEYQQIQFHAGDTVYFRAGGCVQTGGHGATWKRYVNPSGPNSLNLYHGEIEIPGAIPSLSPLSWFMSSEEEGSWVGNVTVKPQNNTFPAMYLTLGYTDDDYSDNGYWGHDDGTEDQCKNVGDAFLDVYIVPAPPPAPVPVHRIGGLIR